MTCRALVLTMLAAGLLSIPSACNRESNASGERNSQKPTQVAGAASEAAKPARPKPKGTTEVVLLSDSNFEEVVLKSDRLVVVDFYADWCGPCKMLAPILKALAKEYDGDVLFAKLNTDHAVRTKSKYSIRALPTIMFFRDGKPVDTHVGLQPRDYLKAVIDKAAQ